MFTRSINNNNNLLYKIAIIKFSRTVFCVLTFGRLTYNHDAFSIFVHESLYCFEIKFIRDLSSKRICKLFAVGNPRLKAVLISVYKHFFTQHCRNFLLELEKALHLTINLQSRLKKPQ